jgi:transcriptional regulator with PAS, ATPase and Fis domain
VSELFGYENGAFTGAIKGGRRGRLESANGGTVFLDDVDCLPKSAQTSLLRFIETGEIQKMGTSEVHKANARIICASNCDLKALVERGEFRLDLYYRLGIIRIVIPPLRERKDDIHLFAHHFLKQEECMGNFAGKITISEEAVAKLRDYPWEGNLRELQSALLRAAMVCKDRHIQARDLHLSETISIGATPLPPTLLLSPQMTQALERSGFDEREITELIRFLAEHCSGAFSNHHWVERFGVSTTTARNKLKSLEAIGLIRREGTKKGSKYYMIIKDEI